MSSEIRENLWVGDGNEDERGYSVVVDCEGGIDAQLPQAVGDGSFLYAWFPFQDGPLPDEGVLMAAVGLVVSALSHGRKVLVHCGAGINRANLVAGLVLVWLGMKGEDAIKLIREKRSPQALSNAAFAEYLTKETVPVKFRGG